MDDIKKLVFSKRPKLEALYEKEKDTKLVSYLETAIKKTTEVKKIFVEIFKEEVERIFSDKNLSEKIEEYFSKTNYISTVDHHGVLSHPSFFQAHLVQALVAKKMGLRIIPVLSSGSVSLDNHTFPRGFIFHGKRGEERIPLISSRHRQESILGAGLPEKEKVKTALSRVKQQMSLSLYSIIERSIDIGFSQKSFSDYVSVLNKFLFNNLPKFGDIDLLMIPHEKVSAKIILKSSAIQNIIFREDFLEKYENAYKDITGAHKTDGVHGTFLFWRINSSRREKLSLVSDELKNTDNTFSKKFKKEEILKLLESGEFIPSMALSYTIIGGLGLTLGGGFNQVDYLSQIYNASKNIFSSTYFGRDDVMGGDFVYAGVRYKDRVFNATYIDTLKYMNFQDVDKFIEDLQNVTIGQAISGVIGDAYFTDTKKVPPLDKESYEQKIIFQ